MSSPFTSDKLKFMIDSLDPLITVYLKVCHYFLGKINLVISKLQEDIALLNFIISLCCVCADKVP